SVSSCKFCKGNKRHHSLLHFPENSLDGMVGGNSRSLTSDNQLHNNDTSKSTQDKTVSLCSQMNSESTRHKNKIILLGSAVILVKDKNSILHPVRVLIDMGSQRHFITKQCCKKLGLNIFNSANSIQVNGIGDNPQPIQGIANVTVFSRHNDFRLNIQCLVINKISGSARVLQSASANATACLSDTYSYICSEDTSMEGLMNRFLNVEDVPDKKHFSPVDKQSGKDNPSDCLSRGLLPSQLLDHPTWMHGPTWLQNPVTEWPIRRFLFEDQIFPPDKQYEHKNDRALVTTINEQPFFHTVAARLSSWSKLLRVATYVLIFIRKIPRSNTVT
ncbi:hypothetical protein Cfor_11063, partial [Coptotermes formosanus]